MSVFSQAAVSAETDRSRRIVIFALRVILGVLFHFTAAASQVFFFAFALQADGPYIILSAAAGFTSCLAYAASLFLRHGKVKTARMFNTAGLMLGSVFCALILFQLFAAKRSLAEAWLAQARKGQPFGFFSFFAAEIFAVLVLLVSILKTNRKYAAYLCGTCAAVLCCFGIIYSSALFLLMSAATGAAAVYFSGISVRLASAVFPAVLTAAAALILSFAGHDAKLRPADLFPINISRIAAAAAPNFPLLTDIPGYGFSAGSSRIETHVFLSPRTLFEVTGPSEKVLYLRTGVFSRYWGGLWTHQSSYTDEQKPRLSADIPPDHIGGHPSVTVTLIDDFYTVMPTMKNTVYAQLHLEEKDILEKCSVSYAEAIVSTDGFRRGDKAVLFIDDKADEKLTAPEAADTDTGIYSAGLITLSRSLMKGAEGKAEMYVQAVLEYFQSGYVYTLDAGKKPENEDAVLHFLFTSKKGFCVHFASSFVLLARQAGIPCRLAEGFRVETDDTGHATAAGTNAHAWAEVWLNGAWQTVETVPILRTDTALRSDSRRSAARDLEETDSGENSISEQIEKERTMMIYAAVCISSAAVVLLLSLLLFLLIKKRRSDPFIAKRKILRRLVKKYRKKHIASPETTGWTEWIERVSKLSAGDSGTAQRITSGYYRGSAVTRTQSLVRRFENCRASDIKD